ncbi:MAG: GAF domain-containing protein [Chloroflexi bacterium]|nr:GAF domain-containing protein [Chloroflexota bacterium]
MKTMCQMERVEELEREVLALRERLSRLSEASMRISESLDFQAVLQGILDSARSLTGARYGVIYLEDHSGQVEDYLYSWLSPEETALLVDLPEGPTLATYLHMLEEPLCVRDFQNFAIAQGLPEFRPPFPTGSTIPILAAPIRHLGERVGAIFVGDTHR